MKEGYLTQYYEKVAVKRLSEVEVNLSKSNQHEFNGSKALKELFGSEKLQDYPVRFIRFDENHESPLIEESTVTWYDAREKHLTRSEYRLYFRNNSVMDLGEIDDLLIIARKPEKSIDIIITESFSTYENQLIWLFGLSNIGYQSFSEKIIEQTENMKVNFVTRSILDELDIKIVDQDAEFFDSLIAPYIEKGFPKTKEFSSLARKNISVSPIEDPDNALMQWMDFEEKIFRRLEKHLVENELNERLFKDKKIEVDQFISFSLSVHNRRKSRVGHALENHLEELFTINNIKYSNNKITEAKSKPDFLFPDIETYHNEKIDPSMLTMLGVKTTCKDRWRQVLAEANKIKKKHLLTLEPGISVFQTNEMYANNLTLVLPASIHSTYNETQQADLMNLKEFISFVKHKQDQFG